MNSAIKRELAELKKEVQHRKDAIDVIDALDVTQHIAPVYLPLHDDIQAAAHQYYNLPGGRGSRKSSFCALEIVNESYIKFMQLANSSSVIYLLCLDVPQIQCERAFTVKLHGLLTY